MGSNHHLKDSIILQWKASQAMDHFLCKQGLSIHLVRQRIPYWKLHKIKFQLDLKLFLFAVKGQQRFFFVFMASLKFFCFGLSRGATLTCQDIFLKPKMLSCVFLLPHNTFLFTLWPVSPGVFSFTGTAVQTRTPWQHPEAKQTAYFTTLRYCRCRSLLPCCLPSFLPSCFCEEIKKETMNLEILRIETVTID